MAIDLSKIKVRELPKKNVKIRIRGVEQEQEIQPMTGEPRIEYWALVRPYNSGKDTVERVYIALTSGGGLSRETAASLIAQDWNAAVNLAGEVHKFTDEYDNSFEEEAKEAEKNSKAEVLTDTPS